MGKMQLIQICTQSPSIPLLKRVIGLCHRGPMQALWSQLMTSKGEDRVPLGEAPLLLRKQLFQSNNSGCSWQATKLGQAMGEGGEREVEPPWELLGIAGPGPGTSCSGTAGDTEA